MENKSQELRHALSQNEEAEIYWLLKEETVKSWININCNTKATDFNCLAYACRISTIDIVRQLVEAGADVTCRGEYHQTSLHCACKTTVDRREKVEILLKCDSSIANLTDTRDDNSPLHFAAANGYADVIRILVRHGACVNAKNTVGETALHRCVNQPNVLCTHELMSCGATIDVCDYFDNNPVHTAAIDGQIAQVEVLVYDYKADVNVVNNVGNTPLHEAVAVGDQNISMIKMLVSFPQCDFTIINHKNQTAADLAADKGHTNIANYLNHQTRNPPKVTTKVKCQPKVLGKVTERETDSAQKSQIQPEVREYSNAVPVLGADDPVSKPEVREESEVGPVLRADDHESEPEVKETPDLASTLGADDHECKPEAGAETYGTETLKEYGLLRDKILRRIAEGIGQKYDTAKRMGYELSLKAEEMDKLGKKYSEDVEYTFRVLLNWRHKTSEYTEDEQVIKLRTTLNEIGRSDLVTMYLSGETLKSNTPLPCATETGCGEQEYVVVRNGADKCASNVDNDTPQSVQIMTSSQQCGVNISRNNSKGTRSADQARGESQITDSGDYRAYMGHTNKPEAAKSELQARLSEEVKSELRAKITNVTLTEQVLRKIAKGLGRQQKSDIAVALGVSHEVVEQIEFAHSKSLVDISFKILLKWRDEVCELAEHTKVELLKKALIAINKRDLIEHIQ